MKNTIFLFLGLFLLGGPIVQAEEALPETPPAAEETAEEFEDDDPVMDIVTTDGKTYISFYISFKSIYSIYR